MLKVMKLTKLFTVVDFRVLFLRIFRTDLRHLYVQSAEEAFKFYQYGRKNLCIASTKLNDRSSRSHCIFTIQVINLEDLKAPTVSKY